MDFDFEKLITNRIDEVADSREETEKRKALEYKARCENHVKIIQQIRKDSKDFSKVARSDERVPKYELEGIMTRQVEVPKTGSQSLLSIILKKPRVDYTVKEEELEYISVTGWNIQSDRKTRTVSYETQRHGEITTWVESGLFLSVDGDIYSYTNDGKDGFKRFEYTPDLELSRIEEAPIAMTDVAISQPVIKWREKLTQIIT